MQILKKFFIFTLIAAALSIPAAAAYSKKPINWYFKPQLNGARPQAPHEAPFLSEQHGYYIGKDEKKLYLTFDVGYENGNVKKILDTLKANDVKAAFFILDNVIKATPELVRQMVADGHLVCNHTMKHKDMTKFDTIDPFAAELQGLEKLYKNTIGGDMAKYYRPPQGRFNEENLAFAKELGYKTIFWSLAYADWDNAHQMKPEKAIEKLMSRMHNGAVILLHPTSETNAVIMDELLRKLKAEGYSFESLDSL